MKLYLNGWFRVESLMVVSCLLVSKCQEVPDLNGTQVLSVCVGGSGEERSLQLLLKHHQEEVTEWGRVVEYGSTKCCTKYRNVDKNEGFDSGNENKRLKKIKKIDVQVSKRLLTKFKAELREKNLRFYVKISNLKRKIKENSQLNRAKKKPRKRKMMERGGMRKEFLNYLLGVYPKWDELDEWLHVMQGLYPHLISLESIGTTFEGRKIYVVKIKSPLVKISKSTSSSFSSSSSSLPVMWLDAGMHAREWVTVSSAVFIITKIVKILTNADTADSNISNIYHNYNNIINKNDYSNKNNNDNNENNNKNSNNSAFLYRLVSSVEWQIAPLLNPDGYHFSHSSTETRMWRKNRSVRRSGYSSLYNMQCHGADLNRNFKFMWGEIGASDEPCYETYKGESAASENETMAMMAHWKKYEGRLKGWMTLHSYGQMLMNRWAYAVLPHTPEYNETLSVVKEASDVIRSFSGQEYVPGSAPEVLYAFSGGSGDWVRANIKNLSHVYDVELRDKGNYGFLLPPSFALSVASEVWQAVLVVVSHVTGAVAEPGYASAINGNNRG